MMENSPIRIGMWSGPRNISTALMRSFGSRADCFVTDEPLYAHYLHETGFPHPGRKDTLAAQSTDANAVSSWLTGPVPGGTNIWYQKHMAHHLLNHTPREWIGELRNVILIRDPAEMITSYMQVISNPSPRDLGLPQQSEMLAELGDDVPVVDSKDILENPSGVIQKLCAALDIPWDENMLTWEAGPWETDGVWAPHWYADVNESTGFATYKAKGMAVPDSLQSVLVECQKHYDPLFERRLTA